MDEKDKQIPQEEFSLEEILKEFGSGSAAPLPGEEAPAWEENKPEQILPETEIPSDTVRLDEINQAVRKMQEPAVSDETAVFTPVGDETAVFTPVHDETAVFTPVSDETVRFAPLGGEDRSGIPAVPAQQEKAEPFSDNWEPEYEMPIGEYIPPEPIVFRPRNRLRELKRKLVEGPERRYYELSEQGVGKLQTAIFLNLLVTVAAAGAAVMYQQGYVQADRTRLLVFGQVLALLLSGLFGSYQLMGGFSDLIHRRFSLNTLLLFSFLACCADSILCLRQVRVPCCAAFSLQVTMSLWSECQKRKTELDQMDTMRKATRLDSLVLTEDYYEGRPGYLRGEGQVEHFMDTYNAPAGPEKVLSVYALVALFVSLAVGVAAGLMNSVHMGIQVFSASLLVAVPASGHVAYSKPMVMLERRLKKHGSVICGWRGVVGLCRPAAFPLTDTDLFPGGSAKLNGVKFYGTRDPDEVVAYAAALIGADGGSMAPLVSQLLESRSGYHYEVEGLRSYPGGIGGVVNDEAVLAGTQAFLESMGVDMPKGTKVSQAVYLAIDGQLCGVFAVSYSKVKSSAAGLTTLCSYRRLTPVMVTGDFMLTESFLRGKFGVNTKRMAFPNRKVREELAQRQPREGDPALALTTRQGLAGMAYAVTGSRALRSSYIVGTVVHMLGGILGLAIMAALTVVGADHLLTAYNILLYQLVWMIPGLLVTEWTRSV